MSRWTRKYRLTRTMEAAIRERLAEFDKEHPKTEPVPEGLYGHMDESRRVWQRHEHEHSYRAGFMHGAWALEDLIRQRR